MESVLDNGADTQTFYNLFFQTNYPLWLWNTMFVAVTATLRRPAAGCRSIAEQICTLIYVLDRWFEWWSSARLRGEAYLLGYIDDFVLRFRNRRDALWVQDVLCERLATFNLKLEPTKTRLVAFGRFAQQNASNRRA
jgi:hypothetical protein